MTDQTELQKPPPLILTSSNRKGGVGKSTTIFMLAGVFAARAMRVLCIDGDPQGSLSQAFFSSSDIEQLEDARSLTGLFDERLDPDPASIIYGTSIENLFLLPASPGLARFNHATPHEYPLLLDTIRQLVREVGPHFDCILIDTAPSLGMLNWSAMAAADGVITPVAPEDFAAQGLIHVKRFIEDVQAKRNPQLRWLGILLNMVQPRLSVHQVYEEMIRKAYGDLTLTTCLPFNAVIKEAVAARQPLSLYKPKVASAKAFDQLAEELFTRVGRELPPVPKKKPAPRKKPTKEAA